MSRKAKTSGEVRSLTQMHASQSAGVDFSWVRGVVAEPSKCEATWPRGGVASWVLGYRKTMLSIGAIGLEILDGTWLSPLGWGGGETGSRAIENAYAQWAQRHSYPVLPLQIGVLTPGAWSEGLMASPTDSHGTPWIDIEWVSCPTQGHALSACRDYGLDAVVQSLRDDGFGVYTCEHPSKPAAVTSWTQHGALSFAGLFPMRIDASCLTLSSVEPGEMRLARSLLVAMAVCSRHPQRLKVSDVINGRLPTTSREAWPRSVSRVRGDCHWALQAMRHVARELVNVREVSKAGAGENAQPVSSTVQAAARCISAWATSAVTAIHDAERHALTGLAVLACPEDAVIAARHCATLIAMGDDVTGRERLLQLTDMLAKKTFVEDVDHIAFVLGELAQCGSPLSTGRLAVGCCMLASTLDARGFDYAREDVIDEIRRSGAMVEREADQAMVISLLRSLEGRGTTKGVSLRASGEARLDLRGESVESGHQEPMEANYNFEQAQEQAAANAQPACQGAGQDEVETASSLNAESEEASIKVERGVEEGVVRRIGKREKAPKARKRTRKAA